MLPTIPNSMHTDVLKDVFLQVLEEKSSQKIEVITLESPNNWTVPSYFI